MQPGELFSTTGKRIDYLYKHLDREVRGNFLGAGILQKDADDSCSGVGGAHYSSKGGGLLGDSL